MARLMLQGKIISPQRPEDTEKTFAVVIPNPLFAGEESLLTQQWMAEVGIPLFVRNDNFERLLRALRVSVVKNGNT